MVKPAETADKEAKALMAKLAKLPPDARMILLDEKGEAIDSAAFAKRLSLWLEDKTPPVFVICGANGASAQIRRSAAHKLSLSAMTFFSCHGSFGFCGAIFSCRLYFARTSLSALMAIVSRMREPSAAHG